MFWHFLGYCPPVGKGLKPILLKYFFGQPDSCETDNATLSAPFDPPLCRFPHNIDYFSHSSELAAFFTKETHDWFGLPGYASSDDNNNSSNWIVKFLELENMWTPAQDGISFLVQANAKSLWTNRPDFHFQREKVWVKVRVRVSLKPCSLSKSLSLSLKA